MNIKRFTLLTVSFCTAISGVFLLNEKPKENYFPRSENIFTYQEKLSGGYSDHLNSLRNNRQTGTISVQEINNARTHASKMRKSNKALGLNWRFRGPDNVGGRTRALIIDKNDTNHIMAGSVSGGIWESFNGAVTWQPYDNDFKINNISSITQGADGTFYVATGSGFESRQNSKDVTSAFSGTGIYKLTGNGNSDTLVAPVLGLNFFPEWATVNRIVADPNNSQRLFAAMNRGLRESTDGGATWNTVPGVLTSAQCHDVEMLNGNIVASFSNSIYVSTDDGASFTSQPFSGARFIQVAIAPTNEDIIYASIAGAGNCLLGVYRTNDAGANWEILLNTPDYFNNGLGCQGWYDNDIVVFPNDAGKIIVGGIGMFQWRQSSIDPAPIQGEWKVIAATNEFNGNNSRNNFYVHADKHKFVFHPTNSNKLYIASDGGIGYSENIDTDFPIYGQNNLGYNVTQFYDIGVGPNDQIIGGTQDNGTQLVGLNFNTGKSSIEVRGGDGFDSELFTINPSLGIATLYAGNISRVQGIGTSLGSSTFNNASIVSGTLAGLCATDDGGFFPGCSPLFYTNVAIWESFDHTETNDSVFAIYDVDVTAARVTGSELPPLKAGTALDYASKNNNWPLQGILTADLFPFDTSSTDPRFITNIKVGMADSTTKEVIAGLDTIIADNIKKEITFNYRGKASEIRSFNYGVPITYTSIFHRDDASDTLLPLTVIVDTNALIYQDPGVIFNYTNEFPDIVQSTVALTNVKGRINSNERNIWISKDVLKGGNVNEPLWFQVTGTNSSPTPSPTGSEAITAAFSNDGDKLFYGTTGGRIYRVDGINNIDVSQILVTYPVEYTILNSTSHRLIANFGNRAVTGITVDPQNSDNVVVTLGNYGQAQYVQRSTNATAVSGVVFSNISGTGATGLPDAPVYEAIIDRKDNNRVVIASEIGVFASENAFTTNASDVEWTEENTGLGRTPVFSIKQMKFGSDVGAINEGKIYIGTHGRGIFESSQLVGLNDNNAISSDNTSTKPQLNVYPNPVVSNMNLDLKLNSRENVRIELYTIAGQLVKEFTQTNLNLGENTLNLDMSDLVRGTYIIRAIQSGEATTAKFIKQ